MNKSAEERFGSTESLDLARHAVMRLNSDPDKVERLIQSTPIRVLEGRTIAKAVSDGDIDKVLRYLKTLSGGQNG